MVLITAVMLMMLLCGCRTRLTNNTDVGNMITDDSGMLSESYQTRRDELGIPIAESPLFKGTGSDEEYDDSDEEYEDFGDEDEEEYEDDEDIEDEEDLEDEDVSTARRTTSTTTTTTTSPARRTYPQVQRRPSVTQTTTVKVSFNPNGKGAKCLRTSAILRKGSTYGTLPTPTRDGYDFEGWYTEKTKGSKVSSTTKIKDKDHTLYAHWKEVVKKTYKITFNGNGDEDEDDVELSATEIKVKEGGTYGSLPSAKRAKYIFKGWFTDAEKGSQITSKTKFTANENQTLYAHWDYDAYKWWNAEYKKAANEIDAESESEFLLADGSEGDGDKAESFMNGCRVKKAGEESSPAFIVKFIEEYSDDKADQAAEEISVNYGEIAPDARIMIISTDAIYGSKEEKLLYKMTIFNEAYEGMGGYDLYEVKHDLNDGNSISYHTY